MFGLSLMPLPKSALIGSYHYRLVSVPVLVAILASYAALDLAARVTAAHSFLAKSERYRPPQK